MQKLIIDFKSKTITLEGSWKFSELIKQVKSIDDFESFTINTYSEKDKVKTSFYNPIVTPLSNNYAHPFTTDKIHFKTDGTQASTNITYTAGCDPYKKVELEDVSILGKK